MAKWMPPGSKEARENGCTCCPIVNREGKGCDATLPGVYTYGYSCPLHSYNKSKVAAKKAGIVV